MHEILMGRRNGNVEYPPIADPYIGNVSLLMHMDTAGGSSAFMDTINSYQFNVVSPAMLSSAQKRFGPTSAYFDGSGGYAYGINRPGYSFGTGDFTIEAYVYFVALNNQYGQNCFITGTGTSGSTGGVAAWAFFVSNDGTLVFDNAWQDSSNGFTLKTAVGTIKIGKWHHVAISRIGNSFYLLINGKNMPLSMNTYSNGKTVTSGGTLMLGRLLTGSSWNYIMNGFVDEVRITKGVGRYNGDFSVYPAPYANPGQF